MNEYRKKYKIISQLLDDNPQLVSLVHQDLAKMLSQSKRGRKSEYTSEQILRSLVVMFVEQDSLRQVVIRIENSEFLRHFVCLGIKPMMDFSFLDKAFCVLSDRTWETMNRVLAEYAKEQEKIALVTLHRAGYEAELLAHYIPIVEKIIHQAKQRVFQGVMVAADEKVYSLFEEHTELLKRGKAGKPIEFGHKILIAQTGEKFIHHYQVFPKREEDKELLEPTLKAHKQLFGTGPDVLATDKGFYENMKQIPKLQKNIETVSICKKGRRNREEYERECTEEFKDGQRFRAGCESSISVLKRVFNLGRCLFKGFKNYAASVGCAVFCHNLILLTRL